MRKLLLPAFIMALMGCSEQPVKPIMTPEEQNSWILLKAKMEEHQKSLAPLNKIKITDSSFKVNEGKPEIRFSVKNGTTQNVYQIQLRLELWQDEVTPAIMEYLNLPIPEGLLPSGQYEWALTPSNSQQWRQLPNLEQSEMKLFVEHILDKHERPIYSVIQISKPDRLRYLELRSIAGE